MVVTNVQIQLASPIDLDRLLVLIVAFHQHLQKPVLSQDALRFALQFLLKDARCDFAIAKSNTGIPLAYAQIQYFYSLWSVGLEAKLEDLFVYPDMRGQGLGSKLLEFAVERAHERQCRLIGLNTNEQNSVALSLYHKQGFSSQPSQWQGGQQLWLEKSL